MKTEMQVVWGHHFLFLCSYSQRWPPCQENQLLRFTSVCVCVCVCLLDRNAIVCGMMWVILIDVFCCVCFQCLIPYVHPRTLGPLQVVTSIHIGV